MEAWDSNLNKFNGNLQLFYLLLLLSQEDFKSTNKSEIVMKLSVNTQKWYLLFTQKIKCDL